MVSQCKCSRRKSLAASFSFFSLSCFRKFQMVASLPPKISLLPSFSMLIFVKSILIELSRSCSFLSGLTVSDYFIDQILTLGIKRGCVMYRLIAMWESFSFSKLKLISSQPLPKGQKKNEDLEVPCQGTETLWQIWPDMTIVLQPSCLMANTMTKRKCKTTKLINKSLNIYSVPKNYW